VALNNFWFEYRFMNLLLMFKKPVILGFIASAAILSSCAKKEVPQETHIVAVAPKMTVDEFIDDANKKLDVATLENNTAQWVYETYITDDSALISAKSSERFLTTQKELQAHAREYQQAPMNAVTAKAYINLTKGRELLPPDKPEEISELATLGTKMSGIYGAAKYCKEGDKGEKNCRDLTALSEVMAKSRNYEELLDAWTGWHSISPQYRNEYARYIELANVGARAYGFNDLGASWRSGYDMPAVDFETEVERLWAQVEPLYKSLQCKVRSDLSRHYGVDKVPLDKPIPAHLLGDMWSQQWGNVYSLVEPYPGVGSLNITDALVKQKKDAVAITKIAENFFVSLGMQSLPESFWQKSMLTKPPERDVVCHASAWTMDARKDVRIKQCIQPTEEEFLTIHHELGHIYYFLAYNNLPILFQNGAHDGFHEAIGDTVMLSITPEYLKKVGLIDKVISNDQATINQQMRMALEKIAFLPFGKLIDQWRWKVYSGEIKPENYNKSWWQLRTQYQGIAAPVDRSESDFDAGAKYHIAANVPYTRYFLAHILQFQFHKALCNAAGFKGPLYQCSIYDSKAAGEKLQTLLAAGASQPWQDTLQAAIGTRQMDASAILEYFAPLTTWLDEQNKGKTCGW
jgi:peptidyl-dipeptidase A